MGLERKKNRTPLRKVLFVSFFVVVVTGIGYWSPALLAIEIQNEQAQAASAEVEQFPVTVDPKNKLIVENAQVNIQLESALSKFQAAAENASGVFSMVFEWIATTISDASWYQNVAAVNGHFVNITAGMRKEQVASAFAKALAWSSSDKKEFLAARAESLPSLSEGSFAPGVYFVQKGMTPREAEVLVNDRFYTDVLSRYGTSTAALVPLADAITIASLIQREAGPTDMRIVSGIIWKRLFSNMKLQIDATVQYAKANRAQTSNWWPQVGPGDSLIKSPYNTYAHAGLPPAPIANPSVAAVVAALNPIDTPCLFYFHDKKGVIHCTETYAEHSALLKKYYGTKK